MPSLILTTFGPFEQFAHAKSIEGALFIFSPSKHAPVFCLLDFLFQVVAPRWVHLVFETNEGFLVFETRRGFKDHKVGMLECEDIEVIVL